MTKREKIEDINREIVGWMMVCNSWIHLLYSPFRREAIKTIKEAEGKIKELENERQKLLNNDKG